MDTSSDDSSLPARELVASRLLDAPRELVFRAFTEPDHLSRWWGPKGFTNTIQEFDPRPGGAWRFTMHGPDGKDYHNQHVFAEIHAPERIVLQHVSAPRFELTVTLAESAGQTQLTWRMLFESSQECARVKTYAVEANEQNLDRLSAELEQMGSVQRPFVISRVFDAPRDLVWKVWTEREHMQWWGPKGVTIRHARLELRPGGVFHYCMRNPDGRDMWGKWVIQEIQPPERLVFVNSFSDEAGGLTRHPMSPTWPLETLSTVTFGGKNGKTLLTVQWLPMNASKVEHKTFDGAHEGMKGGWTGTFDQLAGYLNGLTQ